MALRLSGYASLQIGKQKLNNFLKLIKVLYIVQGRLIMKMLRISVLFFAHDFVFITLCLFDQITHFRGIVVTETTNDFITG